MANWADITKLGDPRDPNWQKQNLTTIQPVPGQSWQVYKPAAAAFQGLIGDLVAEGYQPHSSGGFNYRTIRGSDKLSQHAFGNAIDINADTNPMLTPGAKVVTDLPANTGELAKKWGLEWGGTWKRPDAMHFEYNGPTDGSQPAAPAASLGSLYANNAPAPTPTNQPPVPGLAAAPATQSAPGAFGDMFAQQPTVAPPDFGTVVAGYLAKKQADASTAEADQQRRNALLGQIVPLA